MLRALIPTWGFFDEITHAPVLWFRISYDGLNFGEWIRCLVPSSPRRLRQLFFNPQDQQRFASQALLVQFLTDLGTHSSSVVSQELVQNLVRSEIKDRTPPEEWSAFSHDQFRITVDGDEAFISEPRLRIRSGGRP